MRGGLPVLNQEHHRAKSCFLSNMPHRFSVSHGGKSDVSLHDKSAKHKHVQETQKHAQPVTSFVTTNVSEANQVAKAEMKMSMLCAKDNVALSFSDDFNRSVAEMFSDSAVARKTKATQLIKGKIQTSKVCCFKINRTI